MNGSVQLTMVRKSPSASPGEDDVEDADGKMDVVAFSAVSARWYKRSTGPRADRSGVDIVRRTVGGVVTRRRVTRQTQDSVEEKLGSGLAFCKHNLSVCP